MNLKTPVLAIFLAMTLCSNAQFSQMQSGLSLSAGLTSDPDFNSWGHFSLHMNLQRLLTTVTVHSSNMQDLKLGYIIGDGVKAAPYLSLTRYSTGINGEDHLQKTENTLAPGGGIMIILPLAERSPFSILVDMGMNVSNTTLKVPFGLGLKYSLNRGYCD